MKQTIFLVLFSLFFFSSCEKEEITGSNFIYHENDTDLYTKEFDDWLYKNYTEPFNVDFIYKMQDIGSDMNFNLVPVSLQKADEMAKLIKYLWYDVYETIRGKEFLQQCSPRIIHLIGSSAYNSTSHTEVLGTAEGGIKITLYRCNEVSTSNIQDMNKYYFQTMHHEFAHILHQKKSYPVAYNLLSAGKYNQNLWSEWSAEYANSIGFITPYAGSEAREDFVEVIANRLVMTDEEWDQVLKNGTLPNDQGINGKDIILQKYELAKNWLRDSWGIDIEKLREEIKERQNELLENPGILDNL